MNISDIQRGKVTTIEVKKADEDDFERQIPVHSEVNLQYDDVRNAVLLKLDKENIWSIKGINKQNQNILNRITEQNLPKLCWIATARPKKGNTEHLVIQVHEFPSRYIWSDPVDLGVDEKIVDDIRKKRSSLTSVDEAVRWLEDIMIIQSKDESMPQRVLLSGSPTPQADQQTAFRLLGKGFAVDVVKKQDDHFIVNKLVVNKLVTSKKSFRNDELRPVMLVEGQIRFCDATVAGRFRGIARTELDQIVAEAGSYLGIWKQYNKLETNNILQRARTFGCLQYNEYKPLPDGKYRFHLTESPEKLEKAFCHLEENESISLEISARPPKYIQKEDSEAEENENEFDEFHIRKKRLFFGKYVNLSRKNKTLDIQPPSDREPEIPPKEGVIYISQIGDRVMLERREEAHALILSAECPMPKLGLLIENKPVENRRGKIHKPLSAEAKKMMGGIPTERQIKAIDIALNTPDIALIQGPPGTGKTDVIATLQVRLAELSEDQKNISGSYLLTSYQHDAVENVAQRTQVFGLPAVKIGKKSDQNEEKDGIEYWRKDRIEAIRADLSQLPDHPLNNKLKKIRNLATAYMTAPSQNENIDGLLKNISEIGGYELSPELRDRLLKLRQTIKRGSVNPDDIDDNRELLIKAVRALRTETETFCDDGPRNALKLLLRFRDKDILEPDEERVLTSASEWDDDNEPDFLDKLKQIKENLLDRLNKDERPAGSSTINTDVEELLSDIVSFLYKRVRESKAGPESVLYDYLDDLENDPAGVRDAIRNYTLVLAATCQHSVGGKIIAHKGGNEKIFDTVIVDEAARANPLDLFIPMSLAERRIILFGDHRQLPHILEADIEKQLELSEDEKTHDNIKKSLFYKLFQSLKEREAQDGIKRTITLDKQFRMHPVLGNFVSVTFYEPYGEGFESPRPASDFVHNLEGYENAVAVWKNISVGSGREQGKYSKYRRAEARWIAEEVKRLMELRHDFSFGIITFYIDQVKRLYEELLKQGIAEKSEDGNYSISQQWRSTTGSDGRHKERLRIGTVDAFQGKEFDVVFLSMVRSNDISADDEKTVRLKYGHLIRENRLCVALSRQKRLLIVTGDKKMLQGKNAQEAISGLIAFKKLCEGDYGISI